MIIETEELTLNTDLRIVEIHTGFSGDGKTELTGGESMLLAHLLKRVGKSCSREELCRVLERGQWFPWDRLIDVHISSVRRKIGLNHFARDRFIKTVRGKGYYIPGDWVKGI